MEIIMSNICEVRLVGTCIKRREVVDGARRVISEKQRRIRFVS